MSIRAKATALAIPFAIALASQAPSSAKTLPDPWCRLALQEERADLEDLGLAVTLARSRFAAFEQIFKLIEGLWTADAIDRMSYLRAKYDYDSARLELERNDLLVERQTAAFEQYRLMCDEPEDGPKAGERARAIERAHQAYLRADCARHAKAVEIAEVNLTFNRAYLESVADLRSGRVATRQDVILAELQVALEEQRLADAKRRTEACRRGLPPVESSPPRQGP